MTCRLTDINRTDNDPNHLSHVTTAPITTPKHTTFISIQVADYVKKHAKRQFKNDAMRALYVRFIPGLRATSLYFEYAI